MNVAHINTLENAGGAAKLSHRLKDVLNERGHESWMLVGYKKSEEEEIKQISWNQYLQLGISIFSKMLLLPDLIFLNTFKIKNRKDILNADIINLHNLHGGYFNPLALPKLTNLKPTVYTLHDMWAFTGHCAHSFSCDKWQTGCGNCPDLKVYPSLWYDRTNWLWNLKKDIYKKSNFTVVVPSKWLKNKIEKSILSDKDIRLIYNGINQDIFCPMEKKKVRKELNLPQDKTILMFSAHYGISNYWKGGDYLLQALKKINRENLVFLNVGSSEKADKEIDGSIEWISIPYVEDETTMAKYYASSDLFLYPSLADNCPLVVLEAMACGIPVIAFETGGIPELIKHMETGYISEYKNVDDFLNGINLFLDDEDLIIQTGLSARKTIEKHFTLDKMVELYEQLYTNLLNNKLEKQ